MSTDPRAILSPRLGFQRGASCAKSTSRPAGQVHPLRFRRLKATTRRSRVRNKSTRARSALWILIGLLLIASLCLAGPAHQALHHGSDGAAGCDLCHVSMPEAPRFEPVVFWLAVQAVELSQVVECLHEHLLPEQGNARAPPAVA